MLLVWFCLGGAGFAASYIDANRELFIPPASAAMTGADLALSRSSGPMASPANLLIDTGTEMSLYYASHLGAYNTTMFSLVKSLSDRDAVGISLSYLLVPDILVTTDLETNASGDPIYDPARIRYESTSDILGRIAVSHRAFTVSKTYLDIGAAINIERNSSLEGYRGYGSSIDMAITARSINKQWFSTAVCRNLLALKTRWSDSWSEAPLPRATLGFGYRKEIAYLYGSIQLAYTTLDFLTGSEINTGGTFLNYNDASDMRDSTRTSPAVIHPSKEPLRFISHGLWGASYSYLNKVKSRTAKENPVSLRSMTIRAGLSGLRVFGSGVGLEVNLPQGIVMGTDLSLSLSGLKSQKTDGTTKGFPDTYLANIFYRF